MAKCNCIKDAELKTIAHLKTNNPNKIYNEDLNGFRGTGFDNVAISFGEGGGYSFYHPFVIETKFQKVNGEISKPKKETVNIYPTYCCLCGIKLNDDEQ